MLVIAHRLLTVRNVGTIPAIENGQIIERGDYDDPLARRGRCSELDWRDDWTRGELPVEPLSGLARWLLIQHHAEGPFIADPQ